MALLLYNTLSRQQELFTPLDNTKIGFYTCGPTVYDYPHIGNLKAYIMWDIVKRSLNFLGYPVYHVMNITDVGHLTSDEDTGEDKMEKGARREGKSVWEIAQFYTDIFFDVLQKTNILPPDVICKATEHISEQIALVKLLEEKGFTYKIADGIYFDTSKLADYGKLARLDVEGLQPGTRVELVEGKKNITDFALWKFSYPEGRSFDSTRDDTAQRRQMEWLSPWGVGFPGWHVECSAMSMKYLGETFDIHTGGVDHIPVHHTNEIAQSEAATGKPFVKYWLHNNFILVDGKKMAKSAGTFYTLQNVLDKGYSARAVRLLFISSHYRQQQNFTFQALDQQEDRLKVLDRFVRELLDVQSVAGEKDAQVEAMLNNVRAGFREALEDDFNIPEALSYLAGVLTEVNPLLQKQQISKSKAAEILDWLGEIDRVLGILQFAFADEMPAEVTALLEKREAARKAKQFAETDRLRDEIAALGYSVKDTPQGQKVEKK